MKEPDWALAPLRPRHYRTVLADPPWHFRCRTAAGESRAPQAHYPTMDLDAICALPVADLAHPDGAALLLWFSSPFLDAAREVLDAWGFRYAGLGAWAKQSPSGNGQHMGLGYWYRSSAEFWMLGVRGRVQRQSRAIRNHIAAPVREHSRKPDQMHADAEAMFPGPRAELFGREQRRGWSVWGNDVERFGGQGAR